MRGWGMQGQGWTTQNSSELHGHQWLVQEDSRQQLYCQVPLRT